MRVAAWRKKVITWRLLRVIIILTIFYIFLSRSYHHIDVFIEAVIGTGVVAGVFIATSNERGLVWFGGMVVGIIALAVFGAIGGAIILAGMVVVADIVKDSVDGKRVGWFSYVAEGSTLLLPMSGTILNWW